MAKEPHVDSEFKEPDKVVLKTSEEASSAGAQLSDVPEGSFAAETEASENAAEAILEETQSDGTRLPAISSDGTSPPEPPSDPVSEPSTVAGEKPKREGLAKTFGLVAFLNVISKVVGLVRDIVVLQVFGTSLVTDAYFYGYQFTGNILVLFGGLGGPFHSAGVAVLSSQPEGDEKRKLVGQLLLLTFAAGSLISIALYFAAPYLVPIVFPGTGQPLAERQKLWDAIVVQLRFMVPLILIAGLVGLGAGISNSYKEFTWPSLSPAVASIAIVVACLFFPDQAGLCLAIGTLIGAIGQLLVQIPGALRAKPKFDFSFKWRPGLKEYLLMIGPAAVGTSIGQLNVFTDSFFISSLAPGSLTALQNANRLLQLPLGVLLTAMLVPILPRFTEQVVANEIDDLKAEYRKALRILWFTVLPLVTMLLAIPNPIIKLLFERGHFDANSRALVVLGLTYLVPSAFFYVARDLLTRVFYAHKDTQTPFKVGLCSVAVKMCADYLLVGPLGIGGIALSTTLVTIFNMTLLSHLLRRKIGPLGLTSLIRPAIIMLIGSVGCGFTAYYVQSFFENMIKLPSGVGAFASLAVSIAVAGAAGVTVFVGVCLAAKLEEPNLVL
ncbi:murein biosynthesis integral membrane protein MurJ, partial [Candidatus Obscuribacterales bacterium]|nr:murein biosynthesis integral membrane protein MurJ [Candidatus Obscuribacterales bacterium]